MAIQRKTRKQSLKAQFVGIILSFQMFIISGPNSAFAQNGAEAALPAPSADCTKLIKELREHVTDKVPGNKYIEEEGPRKAALITLGGMLGLAGVSQAFVQSKSGVRALKQKISSILQKSLNQEALETHKMINSVAQNLPMSEEFISAQKRLRYAQEALMNPANKKDISQLRANYRESLLQMRIMIEEEWGSQLKKASGRKYNAALNALLSVEGDVQALDAIVKNHLKNEAIRTRVSKGKAGVALALLGGLAYSTYAFLEVDRNFKDYRQNREVYSYIQNLDQNQFDVRKKILELELSEDYGIEIQRLAQGNFDQMLFQEDKEKVITIAGYDTPTAGRREDAQVAICKIAKSKNPQVRSLYDQMVKEAIGKQGELITKLKGLWGGMSDEDKDALARLIEPAGQPEAIAPKKAKAVK